MYISQSPVNHLFTRLNHKITEGYIEHLLLFSYHSPSNIFERVLHIAGLLQKTRVLHRANSI
jgi:hypothetical protein